MGDHKLQLALHREITRGVDIPAAELDHAQDQVLSAIDACYGAVSDPEQWPEALAAMATCFGDVGATLVMWNADIHPQMMASPGLRTLESEYNAHWWKQDCRSQRSLERSYSAGLEIVTDDLIMTQAERDVHPFYTDFLARHGLKESASAVFRDDAGNPVVVTIQRSAKKQAYTREELALFRKLMRHVMRAVQLGRRLGTAEADSATLQHAFTQMEIGVFQVTANGKAVAANAIARHHAADAITIRDGRLAAGNPQQQEKLDAAIDRTLETARAD